PSAAPPVAPDGTPAGSPSGQGDRPEQTGRPRRSGFVVPPMPSTAPTRPAPDAPTTHLAAVPQPTTPSVTSRRPDERLIIGGVGPDHRAHDETGSTPVPSARRQAAANRPGRVCPRCGTENAHDRRLCRMCGADLVTDESSAAQPTRLPWWRRLLRRSERVLEAGTRPRRRRWPRPRLTLPVLSLILLAGAWFGRSQLSRVFHFTQDRTSKLEALRPMDARASSAAPGHQAGAAFDGFNNRYWAPAKAGAGTGQYLEAEFEKPVKLRKMLITSGSSAKEDEFLLQARPSELIVNLTDADGKHSTKKIELRDQPGEQSFDVRGSDVVAVRLTVEGAYGTRENRRLALAEVEFFGRR
ncbi:zinc ribbon domain-containing protein, partial [Streptomyces palmae]